MRLERLKPGDALGARLVHGAMAGKGKVAKGTLVTEAVAKRLGDAGIDEIACALPDAGDLHEDEAAGRLAGQLGAASCRAGEAATGRVNIHADALGLLRYDRERLRRFNLVDEGITLAVVQHNQLLAAGDMAATLKIIPFFVPGGAVEAAEAVLGGDPLLSFHPLSPGPAWLVQTRFEHQPDRLFTATEDITRQRVEQLGGRLAGSAVTRHESGAIAGAIREAADSGAGLILVAGASAIADRGDTLPRGLVEAGGAIDRFGLAVDPGNLLMLGHLGTGARRRRVIGMPGCARSPKLNGLDWVLQLHYAGIDLDDGELADMATGGLLMEIASRPLPRALAGRGKRQPKVEGVLLAAGASTRMGEDNKLLADMGGKPMVRRIAEAMRESRLDRVSVILGHEADAVAGALSGMGLDLVINPDHAKGQGTSLRHGVDNLNGDAGAMMVVLGDMPFIGADTIDALIGHHLAAATPDSAITLPEVDGQRGNPVVWGKAFFDELRGITGDTGGRPLFRAHPAAVNPLPLGDADLLLDADSPEALEEIRQRMGRG